MKKLFYLAIAAFALCACEKEQQPVVNVYENGGNSENKGDNPSDKNGVKEVQLNMNNDYTNWHYFTFSTATAEKLDAKSAEPSAYDIAFHRYDVKTNGLRVAKVAGADFDKVAKPADSEFLTDKDGYQLTYDLQAVMNGGDGYITSRCNPAITNYAPRVDGSMPPVYELDDAVYVVELADGKLIKLKITDHHKDSKSAFIVFKYSNL